MVTRLLLGCVLGMALVTFSPGASVNAQEKHGNFGDGFGGHGDGHGFGGGLGGGSGDRRPIIFSQAILG